MLACETLYSAARLFFEEFKSQKAFSALSVVAFANNIGIAPGIVVGRLQNEGCIQHNMLNDLKEQYVIAV